MANYFENDLSLIIFDNFTISRRDGSLKRYVTYYITSHPELKWLTEIALVEYIGYGNMGCQVSNRGIQNYIAGVCWGPCNPSKWEADI